MLFYLNTITFMYILSIMSMLSVIRRFNCYVRRSRTSYEIRRSESKKGEAQRAEQ